MRALLVGIAILAGCAPQYLWVKPGASQDDFYADSGQCKAQAYGAPGTYTMQVVLIYQSCMQGKGWHKQEQ